MLENGQIFSEEQGPEDAVSVSSGYGISIPTDKRSRDKHMRASLNSVGWEKVLIRESEKCLFQYAFLFVLSNLITNPNPNQFT